MSLLEAALLACLLATVLAIFIPTFARRIRTNKIDEAPELLSELSARTAAYYATSSDGQRTGCLPPPAGPTPLNPDVEAEAIDFASSDAVGHETWEALGFRPERPIRYSYSYVPSTHGCGLGAEGPPVTISFRAHGDLDGDGVRSTFERRARVDADGWQDAEVLHVHQRVE